MGRKRNTFSKAIKQLKSTRIDEKLQTLNEIPTMNTSGLYDVVPGALSRTEIDKDNPTVPDYTGIDWDVDGGDGRDTSGLFDAEGNSLFVTPPGDNSYILGPMASMFYNYSSSDWTMIGYIRESDRRFVNLGYLYENKTTGSEFSGRLEDWTGSPEGPPSEWTEDWQGASNFNSYGQLTLEQALWFRDTPKKGGTGSSGHESSDFRAFYPGPPSSTPDAFGRYYCTITGTPKATKDNTRTYAPMDMQGSDNFSAMSDLMKQYGNNVRAVYKGGKLVYDRYPTIDPEGAAYLRKKAKEHGLSAERAEELLADDPGELLKFVQMQDNLQADIDKYSQQQKDYEREARNIIIELGVDVALTLAGGWILKGIGKGLGFAYKGVKAANKARQINKAAKIIKAADKIDDAAAVAKATQAYNKLNKVQKSAQAANKVQKAAKVKQVNDANIFSRGRIDRSTPWVQRGASKAKSQKTAGQLFKDNIKGADAQMRTYGGKVNPFDPTRAVRGMPGYAQAKSVVNPKIRAINKARVAKGRPRLTADQINPGGFQTGPDEASRRLFTGAANLAKKELAKSVKLWTGVAKGAAKITDASARTITASVAAKEIQKLVGTNTNPETPVGKDTTNKVINVLTDLIPPQLSSLKTPTKMFLGFLSGSLLDMNAGEVIPEHDQISSWENLEIGTDGLSVDGYMQNVFGGEPLSHLTVDSDGNAVLKFNFAPNTNQQEFDQHPGRHSEEAQRFYNALGTYAADLFVGVPIPGPVGDALGNVVAATASALTVGAKKLDQLTPDDSFLGGIETGRNISGDIKIPLEKLKDINLKAYNYLKSKNVKESYTFCANINLSEDRKSNILKNLKNPVVLPESKKKHKVKPGQRYKGKTNFQGMDKLMGDVKPQDPFKKERNAWSKDWQGYNARLSQEKKNAVLELVGDGKQAYNYMLNDSRIKNAEEMEKFWGLHPELYSYVFNGKKYKETRKEQIKGDYLVFLTDENGEKISMLQSDISIKLAEEHEKEMLTEYNKTGEPTPFLKDPLMKRVAKRLKNEIDYPDKPAKKGYPNQPPPKQVDGWHPEYGKKYKYDKLDPVSAVMMSRAPTGDPEIDANVKKASMKPKVEKKRSNWREDIEV